MPRRGRTGTSMGGKVIHVRPRRPEMNTETCKICWSVKGEPCKKGGKYIYTTHATTAKK